jgi:hypothetical protein
MSGLAQKIRQFWLAMTGQKPADEPAPEVFVHDPQANRPHDLDNPFYEAAVQTRMAGVIADHAAKTDKTK